MQDKTANCPPKKKLKTVIISIVVALAMILSFVGGYFSRYIFDPDYINTTTDLMRIIHKFGYVIDPETGEKRELTEEDYADALVHGLLDKYSEYYTAEEYEKIKAESKGAHTGVGVILYGLEVLKIMGNSPAFHGGLRAGDVLVSGKIDGQEEPTEFTAQGYDNGAINFMAACPNDATMYFYVRRGGRLLEQPLAVKKGTYKASYVSYYDSERAIYFSYTGALLSPSENTQDNMPELGSDVALIRLDQFEGGAVIELSYALNYAVSSGRKKIILDLRNNGGGYMDVLTDVASYLVYNKGQRKTLVAVSKGKSDVEEFYSTENNYNTQIEKIAVLANDNTASASECLIGAMLSDGTLSRDNLIIEKNNQGVAKTYGKGIMQTTYLLIGGGAVKLTTARIYWPDYKTCIQGVGIIAEGDNAVEKGNTAVLRAVETLK